MGLRNPQVYTWLPTGLSDNREAKTVRPGDCRTLRNLFLDPSSKGVLAPRPAVKVLTSFGGFTTPGAISAMFAVGPRLYGLVASGLTAGHDQPFCFDTSISAFVAIGGVTAGNVPTTPSTTGNWNPPAAALVGVKLVITHPGYAGGGGGNFFGWFDLTNPAAPTWNAGNTSGGIVLSTPPSTVGMFNNRAYYAVGNMVVFSDVLNATQVTNAGQALVVGSTEPVTALIPQPLTTGTQGILGALLAFKPASIWQITGDYTLNTLTLNEITGSVGCSAQRTIVPTPMGTMFMAGDGIRTVQLAGNVSEPQTDVVVPFYNVNPASRACAAYASDVYRIALDSVNATGSLGRFDYWFALKFNKWCGPHDFTYHLAVAFQNTFALASNDMPGAIFTSNPFSTSADLFTENGVPMTVTLTTSPIDPQPPMTEKASIEMEFAFVPSAATYNVQVLSSTGGQLAATTLQSGLLQNVWGVGTWGVGYWSVTPFNVAAVPMYFAQPLVFKTCVITLTGASSLGLRLGHFAFRYEGLGYSGGDT